ncbi:transposase IS116/IS110/IS902 family protein [Mesorhizobium loti]|uniref:Transposase IS116/IS110/IS902 family protein n=1 Tax=Rhizobium loti TaxID=381 RepID=A0A8E3B1A3_RHILI|nr:transposase [Mesorhizobium loti]PWJ85123.1 transposase IS116/IS110/IS902 family protein [Mesorhizobium loti]
MIKDGVVHGAVKTFLEPIIEAQLWQVFKPGRSTCPHADLFNRRGRAWLERQVLPDDERAAIARHIREIDRLAEDLADLDRDIAREAIDDVQVRRLQTITGVNAIVASGIIAAVGDIRRFREPQKLVSYFGLNPRVRQSGLGLAQYGWISKHGRSHARAMLVEAA